MKSLLVLSLCVASVFATPDDDDDNDRRRSLQRLRLSDRYDRHPKVDLYEVYPRNYQYQLIRDQQYQLNRDQLNRDQSDRDRDQLDRDRLDRDRLSRAQQYLLNRNQYREELDQRNDERQYQRVDPKVYHVPIKVNVEELSSQEMKALRNRVDDVNSRLANYNPRYLSLRTALNDALRNGILQEQVQKPKSLQDEDREDDQEDDE